MRMIQFLKPMRPHGVGDRRVVPNVIAARMVKDGEAVHVPSVFDDVSSANDPVGEKPAKKKLFAKKAG